MGLRVCRQGFSGCRFFNAAVRVDIAFLDLLSVGFVTTSFVVLAAVVAVVLFGSQTLLAQQFYPGPGAVLRAACDRNMRRRLMGNRSMRSRRYHNLSRAALCSAALSTQAYAQKRRIRSSRATEQQQAGRAAAERGSTGAVGGADCAVSGHAGGAGAGGVDVSGAGAGRGPLDADAGECVSVRRLRAAPMCRTGTRA